MKVKLLALLLLIFCGLGIHACERADEYEVHAGMIVDSGDHDFLMKAALLDRSQIEMARLAGQKSGNREVNDYARMLATDHSRNFEKVSALLQEADMNPPQLLSPDMRESLDKLWGLSGSEFDREYVNMTVDDHRMALAAFRRLSGTAGNSGVKIYANETLATLQDHLRKGQEIQSKLFGGNIQ
jgi:putative membrane protein